MGRDHGKEDAIVCVQTDGLHTVLISRINVAVRLLESQKNFGKLLSIKAACAEFLNQCIPKIQRTLQVVLDINKCGRGAKCTTTHAYFVE